MLKLNLKLPESCDRIRGFTLPENGVMFVFDEDEVFRVQLGGACLCEKLHQDSCEFEINHPDYFGVSGRNPILEVGSTKITYQFNACCDFQEISVESAGQTRPIKFSTFSGDWFVATLSLCQTYLIVAEPYLMEVYFLK